MMEIVLFPLPTPIVKIGDDVSEILISSAEKNVGGFKEGDVLVVTSKIVSTAGGRVIDLTKVSPSEFACSIAKLIDKPPSHVEVILREARSIVRMRQKVIVTETKHGFICANSGVDQSNVQGEKCAVTLPKDPDKNARDIRKAIKKRCDVDVAVIISDTFGRPFRQGVLNVAVGCSGLIPVIDLRGKEDLFGYKLQSTEIAVADELAATAGLLMGQTDARIPAVIIRGYRYKKGEITARKIIREPETDIFR